MLPRFSFLIAKSSCKQTQELAAYGMIVLHLARKHRGSGWLLYNRQFRQQKAAEAGLRDIPDAEAWASCFLAFLTAKSSCKGTRELAAYGIILHLARKHRGSGWLLYDRQFWQQKAAEAGLLWSEINPSLMAATVLSKPGALQPKVSPYCLSADHIKEECTLA